MIVKKFNMTPHTRSVVAYFKSKGDLFMPKKKYSVELKLEVVLKYLNNSISLGCLSDEYFICKSDILKWVSAYKAHGVDGLCNSNRTYSGDFKVSVVEFMHKEKMSARKTAAYFNIASYSTVCRWERIYLSEGKEALLSSHSLVADNNQQYTQIDDPDKTNNDITAELQHLRMENEYLKKLNALVQKREKSEKKTK